MQGSILHLFQLKDLLDPGLIEGEIHVWGLRYFFLKKIGILEQVNVASCIQYIVLAVCHLVVMGLSRVRG